VKSIVLPARLQTILWPLLVFCVAFAGYLATPRSSQVYSDSRWNIHVALSLIREGNLDLDEYRRLINPDDYAVQTLHGHQYSFYPIGAPLLAVPFVFVYNLINPDTFALIGKIHPVAQQVIASFLTALTAVLIYLIARLTLAIKQSLLVTFIFAFCTSAWSTASLALWPHGPTILCLTLALYLFLLARKRPWLAQFAGLPLAFSYVIRPLNAIAIVFFSLWVFLYYRKYFIRYVGWSLVVAVPFFITNYVTFSTLFPPQIYSKYANFFSIPSIERLVGPFISPSRGLLIYSPIFIFSFLGLYSKLKNFRENYPQAMFCIANMLDVTLAMIFIAHCLLVSSWAMWYGGYSIGPRMLVDMAPVLIYFLLPVIPQIFQPFKTIPLLRIAFFVCLTFSFAIQLLAVRSDAMWGWNNVPTAVDTDQARLWDWNDPQFLRGLNLLYAILPPGLATQPAAVNLNCRVGDAGFLSADESQCKTSIELIIQPWQAFRWEVNPPPTVKVAPARGQDFYKRPRLAIHLTSDFSTPGEYNLGELKISATQKEGAGRSTTILVPIFLHLQPAAQRDVLYRP